MRLYVALACILLLTSCKSATGVQVEPLPLGRSIADVYLQAENDCMDEQMESFFVFDETTKTYKMMEGVSAKSLSPEVVARIKGKKSWREMGVTPVPPSPPPTEIITSGVSDPSKKEDEKDIAINNSSLFKKIFVVLCVLVFLALPRLSSVVKELKNKKHGS